jgi:outer membrane protein assembly factor BamB
MSGKRRSSEAFFSILLSAVAVAAPAGQGTPEQKAREILEACKMTGGFIVHLGCGGGELTAALHAGDAYLVQGWDADLANVQRARERLQSLGLYGTVTVDRLTGSRLPYIDNLVNLVVAEDLGAVPMAEVMRVLCPSGVACVKKDGGWTKTVKPRPEAIDEWTHYLHDPSNNAVSHDRIVGPPRRMQWIGSPKYGRHHDRMSSVSAAVSAGGRVFYIIDEGSRASILLPPIWTLEARDAFNGTVLWKRRMGAWQTHLWPLKSGPAELPRRLVAVGDRVYATLALNAPLTALDAATGRTIRTYEGTRATEEVICSDGTLFALVNERMEEPAFADPQQLKHASSGQFWDEQPRRIVALDAESGVVLWSKSWRILPGTLAVDGQRVFFHDGSGVICLDRSSGDVQWRSKPIDRAEIIRSFYIPTLVVYGDVVLFSGGETAGAQTGSWYTSGKDTLTALSVQTGAVLWTAYHPPSGYRSAEDLLVAGGLVWTGETTSGRAVGVFTGRDPRTGEVKTEFPPDLQTYWFHHRCYRGKATDNYLMMSRVGTEFIDINRKHWIINDWTRGACLYGVMPANGLVYNPPHPCACYLESKLYGFTALAPQTDEALPVLPDEARLERGPAYGRAVEGRPAEGDWPTYRHDNARSGHTRATISAPLTQGWRVRIGGSLTSPVAAEGAIFLASKETHTVHALDPDSGRELWRFIAGGRVDSPPTVYEGRILFGSADGHVYCLRAADGALIWRFCAASLDRRLMAFEQIESVWPVSGSVLVQDGVLFCVAGRSMFVDGGLRLWRLDAKTGAILSQTVLGDHDAATGKDLQDYVSWLNMPVALPDILSSDGRLIYMRSQPFHPDGTRLPLEKMPAGADADQGAPPATQDPQYAHLFCPTGFLDDDTWHRSYWMYGSRFVSGWSGYYLAGKVAPAGHILVFNEDKVYGFGRKPQYWRWTTPKEDQLFAAGKFSPTPDGATKTQASRIRVAKSASLNPTGKPLTVEAWVRSQKAGGVVLARGGSSQGYALYLSDRHPVFAVRTSGTLAAVSADADVTGRWVHLAGVLTADRHMQLFVDGKLAAAVTASGFLASDPAEGLEIGADEGSAVGSYDGPFAFQGLIDEVRIYHRALTEAQVADHASASSPASLGNGDLALRFSFDQGDASDSSGKGNHGRAGGVTPAKGKFGQALQFTGAGGASSGLLVEHTWTKDLPLLARGMVLAGSTLFVAGPPDLIDEEQAFRRIDDAQVQGQLAEQAAALQGSKGAVLIAVSAVDGGLLARCEIDSPPVFDGMIAAQGRLYLATARGDLVCFREGATAALP